MLKNLFKSLLTKYMLIFAIVGMVIITIVALMTSQPKTPPVSPPEDMADDDFQTTPGASTREPLNLNYIGERNITVSRAGVYQVGKTSQTQMRATVNMIETLVDRYSLESIYDEEDVATYTSDSHTLSVNLPENSINFSRNEPAETETAIDQNKALTAANDFLKIILPEQDLSPITENIEYFKGGYHLEPSTKISASIVVIPFSYTLEGIPLYSDTEPDPFATIMVNSNLQVQKASIQTLLTVPEKMYPAEIITIDDALNNITHSQDGKIASFVETEQPLFSEPNLNRIKQGTLKTVQLEYRVDAQKNLIYPFYRFEGELVDVDDITFYGEIITPAVEIGR
jgi:hypothetical protein